MKDPKQALTQAEHDQLISLLQGKGVKAAELNAALGVSPVGRSRLQLEQALTHWLSTRPKG